MFARKLPLLVTGLALILTACSTADPAPSDETPPDASAPPAPDADNAVLTVQTRATAPDGAALDLRMQVSRSLDALDPEAEEWRSTLTSACGPDFITDEILDIEGWGLVRIDVTAEAVGDGAWPEDLPISLVSAPRGELGAAAVAASGDSFATPVDPAGELGPCLVEQQLTGTGDGYLVLGIRGDFLETEGIFWNGYRYGFSSLIFGEANGVEFSECAIEKTALGEELAAPEVGFSEQADATECSAGIPPTA